MEAAAQGWVAMDPCEETRQAVTAMLESKDEEGLRKAFGSRVEFGTAGLRAEMGPGTSRLNDLVVIQTAQGLYEYLVETVGKEETEKRGVVLGFDHRARGSLDSKRFALLSAAAFLHKSVKVYLFGEFVATPFVPFAVNKFGAAAGVMVTASHNPKNDNGYKVYWGNGCQIIPPHDAGIAAKINTSLTPWAVDYAKVTAELVTASPLLVDPLEQVVTAYFETLSSKLCRHKAANGQEPSAVKVAYTAMHGIGHRWARKSFESFGHRAFVPVPAQVEPDPTFPTVEFPNPEEGEGALKLAMETADANSCTLILANDPDADRLAVAEKSAQGDWRIFTGNEIAALLGHWQWVCYKAKTDAESNGEENAPKRAKGSKGAAMVASTVSSKMLRAIGEAEGFHFAECLTGFKWIGNKSLELREEGYEVVFAFEEAIGFCVGDLVADKDGICAMSVFAEMAGQLKTQGKTCAEHLLELQNKYGHFITNNGYVVSHDAAANKRVFLGLGSDGKYVETCGKYKVKSVRDLLSPGYDSAKADKKPDLPVSSSSNMLTFTFENGCVATLRMSGTEPKLKYYTELSGTDPDAVRKELDDLVESGIKGDFLSELIK